MTIQTYTQEHINTVAKSYERQACKLLAELADKELTILNLRNELSKKEKDLEKQEKEVKPTTAPVNGQH